MGLASLPLESLRLLTSVPSSLGNAAFNSSIPFRSFEKIYVSPLSHSLQVFLNSENAAFPLLSISVAAGAGAV